jgi:hypothetical protein
MLKKCSKCGVEKDAEKEFSKCSKNRDGLEYLCKQCLRARRNEQYRNNGKKSRKLYLSSIHGMEVVKNYTESLRRRYSRLIQGAKRRGIEVSMTLQEFSNMFENEDNCFYCGTKKANLLNFANLFISIQDQIST